MQECRKRLEEAKGESKQRACKNRRCFVVMYMINPEYIGALFTPGPTLLIPIASLVALGLGWVVMGKMADIQF